MASGPQRHWLAAPTLELGMKAAIFWGEGPGDRENLATPGRCSLDLMPA